MSKLDYKLFFYENNKLLKKISFEKGNALNLVAGNSENATLKFDNSLISRNHLQLIYDENGNLHLQDLGSTNGTFLNGNKITEGENYTLKIKDKIELAGKKGILILVEDHSFENIDSKTETNIIDKLNRQLGISIENLIVAEDILTPTLIEQRTSSYRGALYGAASNSKFAAFLRHPNFSNKMAGETKHISPLAISTARSLNFLLFLLVPVLIILLQFA